MAIHIHPPTFDHRSDARDETGEPDSKLVARIREVIIVGLCVAVGMAAAHVWYARSVDRVEAAIVVAGQP
jgi:hypothetical protein